MAKYRFQAAIAAENPIIYLMENDGISYSAARCVLRRGIARYPELAERAGGRDRILVKAGREILSRQRKKDNLLDDAEG